MQNLLDRSRIQAGVLQPRRAVVSLADLVHAVVGDVAPGPRGYAVRVELPSNLPPVDVDVTLISRVLTNLLENSIRHGPKHSTITIGGVLVNPRTVMAYVADHGRGERWPQDLIAEPVARDMTVTVPGSGRARIIPTSSRAGTSVSSSRCCRLSTIR